VKATAAAVGHGHAWNGSSLKWLGITLALLAGCGLASYYYHVYGETDEDDEQDTQTSALWHGRSQFRQVAQRVPAGTFRADFRHHDAILLVKELPQNFL